MALADRLQVGVKTVRVLDGWSPSGHSHWSTRQLGRRVGLGRTTVYEIPRANDLKPHLQRTFKVSKDPRFSEKVQDDVGLYLNPPEHAA